MQHRFALHTPRLRHPKQLSIHSAASLRSRSGSNRLGGGISHYAESDRAGGFGPRRRFRALAATDRLLLMLGTAQLITSESPMHIRHATPPPEDPRVTFSATRRTAEVDTRAWVLQLCMASIDDGYENSARGLFWIVFAGNLALAFVIGRLPAEITNRH